MRYATLIGAAFVTLGIACPMAGAADYEIVASGPYKATLAEAVTYDGTNTGTLPPLLDLPRVEGGSFRATYRFPMVTPPPGLETSYTPGIPFGMTSFQLLDASGVVIHSGSDPLDTFIYVQDNDGSIPFSNDQVALSSVIGAMTNLSLPTSLYSSQPDFLAATDFNFAGTVDPSTNYSSDLGIPTDPATSSANPVLTDADGQMSLLWGAEIVEDLVYIGTPDGQTIFPPISNATGDRAVAILPPNPDGVPEHASISLLAVGVFALLRRRRRSRDIRHIPLITCLTAFASSFATPAAQADLFTYNFTGEVTDVSNPNGLFTGSASLGATVTGSFTYTDSPNQGSFAFNANFTNYTHIQTPADTRMALSIGGAAVHSSDASLSNMIIGNDNPSDEFPPFFPMGDSFRYVDALDDSSTLFDFSQAELFQSASGNLFFIDSTGDLFDSQALPSGLAVSSFDSRFGLVTITDDNFEETGRLIFRIDSVQGVPEPNTAAMLCFTLITLVAWRRV